MRILSWLLCLAMTALAWSAAPAKKPSARKKAPSKFIGPVASAKSKTGSAGKSKKSSAKATTWRNRQMVPTQDRYKEIQEALAAKGYLEPEHATGTWSQASVDALKRFQAEQKIDASGKINSLSLIALGLGPKRDVPAVTAESVGNK